MEDVTATPILVLLLPILTLLAVALVGSTRRIGFWGAILFSLLLTPIGGFVVALISGPKRRDPAARHKKTKK